MSSVCWDYRNCFVEGLGLGLEDAVDLVLTGGGLRVGAVLGQIARAPGEDLVLVPNPKRILIASLVPDQSLK